MLRIENLPLRSSYGRALVGQIIGGSAISLALRVIGVGLSYLVNIILSRLLGVAGYGLYAVALGWALILVLPARIGLDYSALRFATGYREAGNWAALRGFIRVSVFSVAGLAILIGIGLVAVVGGLGRAAQLETLVAAAALIAPLAILGLLSVMLRVAHAFFASQFFDQVLRPGLLAVMLAAWAFAGARFDPLSAMTLTVLAACGALAGLTFSFRRAYAEPLKVAPNYGDARRWFTLSLPLLGVSVVQEVLNQIEIIMLGSLSDPQSAGLFAAAARLVSLMMFALAAFGIVSGPMIASAFHRGDMDELQQITTFTTRIGLLCALICAVVLTLAGPFLLSLFGPEFESAYIPMLVLVGGAIMNAFTGIVVYLATLTGRERPALFIFLVALAISLLLNLILIPRLGVLGAAIASAAALSTWNVIMVIYVRKSLGIDASAIGAMRPARRTI